MNFSEAIPPRDSLIWHVVQWEVRRLAFPLAGWLFMILSAILLVHSSDWSWPDERIQREARIAKQSIVETGMALAAAAAVYLTGELFLPLRPGVVRARFALPPRRRDALVAAFLIQMVLVLVPFVLYYRGWVMVIGWDWEADKFLRQFMPPVPVFAAGLALIAMLTGDWGLYLLTSSGVLLGLYWFDPVSCRHIPLFGGVIIGVVSVAITFAALHLRVRWGILALWVPWIALMMKL